MGNPVFVSTPKKEECLRCPDSFDRGYSLGLYMEPLPYLPEISFRMNRNEETIPNTPVRQLNYLPELRYPVQRPFRQTLGNTEENQATPTPQQRRMQRPQR